MTTIITRLFQDEATAQDVAERVIFRGVPSRATSVISADTPDLHAKMDAALVHPSAQDAYAKQIKDGRALVVVRATYKPLTAATIVRDMMAQRNAIAVDGVVDDYYMPDGPQRASSVLKEHPHFLTVRSSRTGYAGGPVTVGLGFRLLSERKTKTSAKGKSGARSRWFWPMPLLSKKSRSSSVISGGRYMSRAFWPMALLSKKPRSNSVIRGGDLPFSRALGWPPVS
ncbi:hypothetical protein [Ascidiaceihabitans sp.]|uniref:hypothetical protein n=1 Tax=Ascidiaceihabitans sp. TaxID=1872644 RepID=UPI003297E0CA